MADLMDGETKPRAPSRWKKVAEEAKEALKDSAKAGREKLKEARAAGPVARAGVEATEAAATGAAFGLIDAAVGGGIKIGEQRHYVAFRIDAEASEAAQKPVFLTPAGETTQDIAQAEAVRHREGMTIAPSAVIGVVAKAAGVYMESPDLLTMADAAIAVGASRLTEPMGQAMYRAMWS